MHALATPRSAADDRVLLRPTVFSWGAQQDPLDHARRIEAADYDVFSRVIAAPLGVPSAPRVHCTVSWPATSGFLSATAA